jgi:hypothetical protein
VRKAAFVRACYCPDAAKEEGQATKRAGEGRPVAVIEVGEGVVAGRLVPLLLEAKDGRGDRQRGVARHVVLEGACRQEETDDKGGLVRGNLDLARLVLGQSRARGLKVMDVKEAVALDVEAAEELASVLDGILVL